MTSAIATVMPRLHQVNPTQADSQQHPGHLGHRAAHRLVQADLDDEQCGQRGHHRARGAGQRQRQQVREDRGAGQPDDGHRGGLRPVPHHGQRLRRALGHGARRGTQLLTPAPAEEHGPVHCCPSTTTVPGRPAARHPLFG
jgi:hypothetical protein